MRSPMALARHSYFVRVGCLERVGHGETWDGGSLTQCATGAMRPLLGSHKVMFDLRSPGHQCLSLTETPKPGPLALLY